MSTMPRDTGGMPIQCLKPGRTITSSIGASSTEVNLGTAFDPVSTAKVYRLQASIACHIRTVAGSATSSDMPMSAGVPELFKLDPVGTFRQIQATAGGTLFVTEML